MARAAPRRHPSLLLLTLCVALALQACAPGRALEAKRLLEDVAAGDGPSALKETTPAPSRTLVHFTVEGRARSGDLYRPAEPPLAALVLVPGVTPAGKDDRRLVALATSLARVRFTVLVPEIPNLRELQVRPDDAAVIADAVRALTGDGDLAAESPEEAQAGLLAVSYAVGPALLAALRPGLRERLGFLVLIGGYRDITALVTYFTTGAYRAGPTEPWRAGRPAPYAKWAFAKANAGLMSEDRDRVLLTGMAQRKREDPAADLSDLAARLGPEGRAAYDLLENRDPERVLELIAALPPAILDDLKGLDLASRDLSSIDAETILVHGRDDPVIPFTESQALQAAIGPAQADLTLVDNLAHVDLGPGDVTDVLKLWSTAYRLLEARDRQATEM